MDADLFNKFAVFLFCTMTNNAQLFHKLSHSYMFRHYRVILRELVINTLSSYTNISNAAVGNVIWLLVIVKNNKRCTVHY